MIATIYVTKFSIVTMAVTNLIVMLTHVHLLGSSTVPTVVAVLNFMMYVMTLGIVMMVKTK
jgi:hypothetical protein